MIARIHRRLHGIDGLKTVPFRQYLEEFCHEFSAMLSSRDGLNRAVMVPGAEIELPAAQAVPLAFIVSELLTNAAKHGEGPISVRLETDSQNHHLLSVSNEGPRLRDGFDPASCKGLGMKIIRSFAGRIGGELRFGPADGNTGACFTVSFA